MVIKRKTRDETNKTRRKKKQGTKKRRRKREGCMRKQGDRLAKKRVQTKKSTIGTRAEQDGNSGGEEAGVDEERER